MNKAKLDENLNRIKAIFNTFRIQAAYHPAPTGFDAVLTEGATMSKEEKKTIKAALKKEGLILRRINHA